MIDKINSERHEHMITIEDPIEYLHNHKKCLVNQREVHSDTKSFAKPCTPVREDPDVILLGEMRDLETMSRAAPPRPGTGPSHDSHQLRRPDDQPDHRCVSGPPAAADPGPALDGARRHYVSVLLAPGGGQGRAMAMEILIPNLAVRNLIREDKIHQIYSAMQSGQEK